MWTEDLKRDRDMCPPLEVVLLIEVEGRMNEMSKQKVILSLLLLLLPVLAFHIRRKNRKKRVGKGDECQVGKTK